MSLHAIYRRYENTLVRLQNVGAEIGGAVGYYKPKWFVAAEFGFDKALATHFKYSESFKENIYASAREGWSHTTTGGNFYFGLQTGISFKQHDVNLRIGKVVTEAFNTSPLIPYYVQLGYNLKITQRKQD